ncbi:transposase IS116/IS110/IS902 family protein [Cupriavidus sp. HMR-1]|uniref:hypothetical protein n=1 Tax=Cupriavidus TaxID=106589 RepID=UPI0002A329D7|nr:MULTISPECIES: hypothetical protein [Cupriavidus]EKZ96272.1 transposase IS116/IS110/IS902 family protein [Cupriavidus sp. HMR-1]
MLQTLTATLRLLATRWLALEEELSTLDGMLDGLPVSIPSGCGNDSVSGLRPLRFWLSLQVTTRNA